MKRILLSGLMCFMALSVVAQDKKTETSYQFLWVNGGIGAGGVLSTNIVNSGAVLPAYLEFMLQNRRSRIGIGIAHELYLTPENLGKVILGNSSNTEKVYITWEGMLLPNSPINLGVCAQGGGFLVGNDIREANQNTNNTNNTSDADNTDIPKYNFFGNVGMVAEVGIRPVFLFVKPYIEYKSYGGFHKEIIAAVTFGIKLKLITEEEKARRAKKKG